MPRPGAILNKHGETLKGGCVVISEGKILLALNDRYQYWSLPKGHVDAGETPEQSAVRETHEETGWQVDVIRSLGELRYTSPLDGDRVSLELYLAHPVKQTGIPEEKAGWFEPDQLGGVVRPSVIEFLRHHKLIP